jgi:hypothetical protein
VSLEIVELERQLRIKRAEEETLSRELEEICDRWRGLSLFLEWN